MKLIAATNVNTAFNLGLGILLKDGIKEQSRAGEVLVLPCPATTAYGFPTERVLFDPVRDANPFFHLFEALWMLDGRNDATWLDRFVKDFSKRYAESDGIQHGAYGWRWRNHFEVARENRNAQAMDRLAAKGVSVNFDQLDTVIYRLKKDPYDRRVVIQMWDPSCDLGFDKADIPCNLCVLPRIRSDGDEDKQVLDITVMCRSNDAVWGAYGANAVHFSILQEYLAAMIGVDVGVYYQHSNNFHVYTSVLDKVQVGGPMRDPYRTQDFAPKLVVRPLVDDPETFDSELRYFLSQPTTDPSYNNSFFKYVAMPMWAAHTAHKAQDWMTALDELAKMPLNNDWYRAGHEWIMRRRPAGKKPRFSEGKPGGLLG